MYTVCSVDLITSYRYCKTCHERNVCGNRSMFYVLKSAKFLMKILRPREHEDDNRLLPAKTVRCSSDDLRLAQYSFTEVCEWGVRL